MELEKLFDTVKTVDQDTQEFSATLDAIKGYALTGYEAIRKAGDKKPPFGLGPLGYSIELLDLFAMSIVNGFISAKRDVDLIECYEWADKMIEVREKRKK
jgi:hypothetical protein